MSVYNLSDSTSEIFNDTLRIPLFVQSIPVVFSLICILGLVGNGIIVFIILHFHGMASIPNLYILSLAAADFLFLMGLPFLAYFNTKNNWIFGDVMCKIVMGIDGSNMLTGILTLTAMAVDRYLAIVHIVWAKNYRTARRTKMVCLLLWIISLMLTAPLWLYAKTTHTSNGITVCNVICPVLVEHFFIIYAFIIGFVLPLVIISVCYTGILLHLQHNNRRRRRQFRVGRVGALVLTAVLVFVICWLPFWSIRMVLLSPYQPGVAIESIYYISWILSSLNSCINPLLYAFFKHDFQDVLKYCILKCQCSKQTLPRIRASSC
ncbi:somatostatin receptor type 2-like [Glandiceps talaboti]